MTEEEDPLERATRTALRALTRGDQSTARLRMSLRRTFTEATVERALEELQRGGWLDDETAATRLAQRLLQRDLLSPQAVGTRLQERGFGEEAVQAALARCPVSEEESLRQLARRIGLDPARPGRLVRRLTRAGYDPDEISEVVREMQETR